MIHDVYVTTGSVLDGTGGPQGHPYGRNLVVLSFIR